MKASDRLIARLKQFEGLRTEAYRCPAGRWTIGYGHTLTAHEGMIITEEQADHLLREDVNVVEQWLTAQNIVTEQHQFDALVSFIFNLGIGTFCSSTLRKVLRRGGSSEEIREQWCRWVYAGGSRLAGLMRRRSWEVNLFINGEY